MKKLNLLFTALLLMCCVGTAKAVEVTSDGIKYDVITDTKQAKVIKGGNYSGNIVLPSEITYNNVTYSVTSIGNSAFYYCSGLTSITIPNSGTSIGDWAFGWCSGLTSITIPNSVTSIGDYAFYYCSSLTSITIPNSVTSIGDYEFSRCTGLTSITIPNSVTSIGDYAFEYCSGLTSITIPNSVKSIGKNAFGGCDGLTSITVATDNAKYDSRDNSNAIIETTTNTLVVGCKNTIIPNSVTSIGSYAFCDCTGLTSITIPNSVTSIGNDAFNGCSNLKTVYNFSNLTITKGSSNYGYVAYYADKVCVKGYYVISKVKDVNTLVEYLGNDTEITLPADYYGESYVIGSSAFKDCSRLTSITIPNSVTSIGNYAFHGCTSLKELRIEDGTNTLSLGFNYNNSSGIGQGLFYDCPLKKLYLGRNLSYKSDKSHGYSPFYGKDRLTSVTVGNSVTRIGNYAFENCGLTSVVIPDSVTSIGNYAFSTCDFTSITIPNSVTSIGYGAFYKCSGLKAVLIGDLAAWCNISFGSSDANPLYYAKNLYLNDELITELTIPNSVTSIGKRAFYNCSGLTSIEIPNSVTSIGSYAFNGCWGLTSVTIGTGVKNIGSEAFAKCSSLTDVYCLATSVPSTNIGAFNESYPEYMTLHVPAEAINIYKTTAPWSNFGTIVTLDGESVVTPKCENPVIKYSNGELVIECETENTEFVTKITSNDINSFYGNTIKLTVTYNISVYATATGYENSNIVNATLCWIECDCNADDNTGIIDIPAKAVLVTSNNGTINISCSLEGESVELYTSDAMFIESTTIENGCATIESGLSKGDIAIVKIGEKSIKIIID